MVSQKKQKPKAKKPIKAQAPPFDLSQFQIQQRADATGIYITIAYQGVPVHVFVLSVIEYQLWQQMPYEQKFIFVKSRTNSCVFGNNRKITDMVIRATINVLDSIFARAQAQAPRRVR